MGCTCSLGGIEGRRQGEVASREKSTRQNASAFNSLLHPCPVTRRGRVQTATSAGERLGSCLNPSRYYWILTRTRRTHTDSSPPTTCCLRRLDPSTPNARHAGPCRLLHRTRWLRAPRRAPPTAAATSLPAHLHLCGRRPCRSRRHSHPHARTSEPGRRLLKPPLALPQPERLAAPARLLRRCAGRRT
jgi:hypothetical protein